MKKKSFITKRANALDRVYEAERGARPEAQGTLAATPCSALWQLVVSKTQVPGYAEWHANRVESLRLIKLKQKLRDARRIVKVLTLKLQLAKETCH